MGCRLLRTTHSTSRIRKIPVAFWILCQVGTIRITVHCLRRNEGGRPPGASFGAISTCRESVRPAFSRSLPWYGLQVLNVDDRYLGGAPLRIAQSEQAVA